MYDEGELLQAVTEQPERARHIAARYLGVSVEQAVKTGHSIEVAKVLAKFVREGKIAQDTGVPSEPGNRYYVPSPRSS